MVLATSQDVIVHIAKALWPITESVRSWVPDNWAYVPAFMIFFIQVFSVSTLWVRYVNIGGKKAPFLGSCAMSRSVAFAVSCPLLYKYFLQIVLVLTYFFPSSYEYSLHAMTCIFAGYAELSNWEQPLNLDDTNTPIQSLQLNFSLAYLLADILYFLLFDPSDWFFLAHHLLSVLYLGASLHLGVGGISAIFVFFMGEVTTPLYNIFSVAKTLKEDYAIASNILNLVSPFFTFSFVLVRSVISPVLIGYFLKNLLFESPAIPAPYRVFMASLVTCGMVGSQVWSYKLVKGYRKARAGAGHRKRD